MGLFDFVRLKKRDFDKQVGLAILLRSDKFPKSVVREAEKICNNPGSYSEIILKALSLVGEPLTPLEIFGVAQGYNQSGAKYRTKAIKYYEMALLDVPEDTSYECRKCGIPNGNYWNIYSSLANLHEKEYDFVNAEKYYILAHAEDRKLELARYKHAKEELFMYANGEECMLRPNVPLGSLYLKISTEKAVSYWKDMQQSEEYKTNSNFKRIVKHCLAEAQEKHAKGYVYKPRKRKD